MLKEKYGQVAIDYDAEMKTAAETHATQKQKYRTPTGHHIDINEEILKCPELLFSPSLFEFMPNVEEGIHQHTFNAITKCELDIRRDLF